MELSISYEIVLSSNQKRTANARELYRRPKSIVLGFSFWLSKENNGFRLERKDLVYSIISF
jgi:hypothetical protein